MFSLYYINGREALGAPDGICCTIFADYSNGYITLDMGEHEEILNNDGDDFTVLANENHFVWVSNNLSVPFTLLGSGNNTQSFDLKMINFEKARYVKIEIRSGISLQINAIKANYYNQISIDEEPPSIIRVDDFWVWKNVSSITLLWEVEDLTPWNYSISINETIVEAGNWNGADISFEYLITVSGNITISLRLFDLFSNFAEDTVHIEIRAIQKVETEKTLFFFATSIFAISLLYLRKRKKHLRYLPKV
ncbi:MAG: hypothetical protein ACTSP3_02970 [Candidatus Heimdallarchaeaceae archaeon]